MFEDGFVEEYMTITTSYRSILHGIPKAEHLQGKQIDHRLEMLGLYKHRCVKKGNTSLLTYIFGIKRREYDAVAVEDALSDIDRT